MNLKILTFDVEDWFHILDNRSTKTPAEWNNYAPRIWKNTERILTALDENNQKATFFCLGWIAEKYPDLIKLIHEAGHEIGTHGHSHKLLYELDRKAFIADLTKSINVLQNITGKKIKYFRAPGFSITSQTLWAFEVLIELGIEIDCSIFPAKRAHGGLASYAISAPSIIHSKGSSIKELPINLHHTLNLPVIYSGGGYFRLLPYQLIKRWCTQDSYIMTYFHPRDFDCEQPMVCGLSPLRKFKSYVGLKQALNKFRKILANFDFLDIGTADQKINWRYVKEFNLDCQIEYKYSLKN